MKTSERRVDAESHHFDQGACTADRWKRMRRFLFVLLPWQRNQTKAFIQHIP